MTESKADDSAVRGLMLLIGLEHQARVAYQKLDEAWQATPHPDVFPDLGELISAVADEVIRLAAENEELRARLKKEERP